MEERVEKSERAEEVWKGWLMRAQYIIKHSNYNTTSELKVTA